MHKIAIATVALALALASSAAQAQMMQQKSLYDRLGGQPAITAVVDDFVGNVARDRRINGYFAKADIPRLKFNLVNQLCQATGGPCTYTGRDMKSAHAGMGVRTRDFTALVQDLGKSLNKFKVAKADQAKIVSVLAPMKKDIVERP